MLSVLTIAGSDSSGGAGIEADIKTISAHKLFATCAITAITAQNTAGVFDVEDITRDMVSEQIEAVFKDIFPAAVKIGMVSSADIVEAIAEELRAFNAVNVVTDPVMVATSGSNLIASDAIDALMRKVFPLSTVITPNIPEAEVLSEARIDNEADMVVAAKLIAQRVSGCEGLNILIKGGHEISDHANDLLYTETGDAIWIDGVRVDNPNTHGTGCTLSSAIACNLALGSSVKDACVNAKRYIEGALSAMLDLGRGSGPMDHMWAYR